MALLSAFCKHLVDVDEMDPAHVCVLASEKHYDIEHKVSLHQLSYASMGGCPVCRINFQAILLCIPELRHMLQDPIRLDSVSISRPWYVAKKTEKTGVRYILHSESPISTKFGDGYRIFTLEG
jgi:hypothetical protein